MLTMVFLSCNEESVLVLVLNTKSCHASTLSNAPARVCM